MRLVRATLVVAPCRQSQPLDFARGLGLSKGGGPAPNKELRKQL